MRQKIFLIDGTGALLSAGGLVILACFETIFGMPKSVLYSLLPIPIVFAIYSYSCFFYAGKRWRVLLRIIALANLCYILLTAGLVYLHMEKLTGIGIAYFIIEIIAVIILSLVELRISLASRIGN